jgi:hypothetical protein
MTRVHLTGALAVGLLMVGILSPAVASASTHADGTATSPTPMGLPHSPTLVGLPRSPMMMTLPTLRPGLIRARPREPNIAKLPAPLLLGPPGPAPRIPPRDWVHQ